INFHNFRREGEEAQGEPRVRALGLLGPIREPEFEAANIEELRRIPGLHLVIELVNSELRFNFWYHRHRFPEAQVASWAERFMAHLTDALEVPDAAVRAVETVAAGPMQCA